MSEDKIPILMADDNPAILDLMRRNLEKEGHRVLTAEDGTQAWDKLVNSHGPIIVIADIEMPGMSGIDILKKIPALREEQEDRFIFFMMITGKFSEDNTHSEEIGELLALGAKAVFMKPIRIPELIGYIRQAQNALSDSRVRRDNLQRDALTGFHSKTQTLQRLDEELARTNRSDSTKGVAVVFIDADNFKKINDEYDHLIGDEVLRIMAMRIDECRRIYDVAGRYGGDEFVLILPDIDEKDAEEMAGRVCQRISGSPIRTQGKTIPVSTSIGVAISFPHKRLSRAEILRGADVAMYAAKRRGKNQVVLHKGDV